VKQFTVFPAGGRVGAVEAAAGRVIILFSIAAAVVGGMSLLGFPVGVAFIVTGLVLALATTIDALARKRAPGMRI